jgi:O-antigen ligase
MMATGSRGGIAAFVLGVGVYLLPYWKSNRIFAAIGLAGLGIVAVVLLIATTPLLLERWSESYYEGRLSEREVIFAVSTDMIGEHPIFGWGPVEGNYVLASRIGSEEGRDAHNLIFHLLIEGGILGSIPFLIGLCLCTRYAWRARSKNLGLIPLALLIIMLSANLSGNNVVWKPQWLIFALITAIGCGSSVRELNRRSPAYIVYNRALGNRRAANGKRF